MAERVLTRETLLDMAVNAVPIAIILFFVALFLAVNPWGWALLPVAISHGLLAVPIVVLAVVTYLAGRAIARDERAEGERPASSDGEGERPATGGGGGDDAGGHGGEGDAGADDAPATRTTDSGDRGA